MNEKTEAAPPKELEGVPASVGLPAPIEQPGVPAKPPRWRKRQTLRLDDLPSANLKGEDLTKIKGLLPEHLAGLDLTGVAKLPEEIAKFPALDQVREISADARKIFIGLLAACVYSWVVIGTTTDVALILNTASSPLPIINTPIPIAGFYVIGAALLAAVYCYFHFYLQRMWRTLASLPAVFPDGVALDDKTDPWLLTNLVRTEFAHLRANAPPLARLENVLSIVLAWWLVPATIFFLWARYLPAHHIAGLGWLAFLIAATIFFGRHTFGLARASLRREGAPVPKEPLVDRPQHLVLRILRDVRHLRPDQVIVWLFLPFFIIIAFSLGALVQSPRSANGEIVVFSLSAPLESLEKVDKSLAKFLNFVGIRTYADLREVEVAQRPEGWDGRDWHKVKRIDLRGRNLAFADATRAFLTNADLRGANLTSAILVDAELQGADLYDDDSDEGAQLQGIDLSNARLQSADFGFARLQGANLRIAELQGTMLARAQLQGADLGGAGLQGAVLTGAQLQGADLSYAGLQGANLRLAQLWGADLSGARLQGANLSEAELWAAKLSDADLRGVDLTYAQLPGADLAGTLFQDAYSRWDLADLRSSIVRTITDSDTDTLISEATKSILGEERRKEVAAALTTALRSATCSPSPDFPEQWRSEPNVMFSPRDPRPEPFDWGPSKWATGEAYYDDLASFLGDLACSRDAPEAQTRGLAWRAVPLLGRLAARLIGPDCPPAKGLSQDLRRKLERIAARGDTSAAVPKASPPDAVE